jgi:hypothetical protein
LALATPEESVCPAVSTQAARENPDENSKTTVKIKRPNFMAEDDIWQP